MAEKEYCMRRYDGFPVRKGSNAVKGREMTDEEFDAMLKSIIDGTFMGKIYLGEDPEYVRKAMAKYGWERLNAKREPEKYPLD